MGQYFYLPDLRVPVGCSRWPATSLPQSGRCCRRMCCRDGLSCRLSPRLLNCGVARVHRWGGRRGSDTPDGSACRRPHCSPAFEGGAQAISENVVSVPVAPRHAKQNARYSGFVSKHRCAVMTPAGSKVANQSSTVVDCAIKRVHVPCAGDHPQRWNQSTDDGVRRRPTPLRCYYS